MKRAAASRTCPCGHRTVMLLPQVCCGFETIWDLRCIKCGGYSWFDARGDREFRRVLLEVKALGGDLQTQQAEIDVRYAATLPPCGCGGGWRVVRDWDREACLRCGRPMAGTALEPCPAVEVAPARPAAES